MHRRNMIDENKIFGLVPPKWRVQGCLPTGLTQKISDDEDLWSVSSENGDIMVDITLRSNLYILRVIKDKNWEKPLVNVTSMDPQIITECSQYFVKYYSEL